MLHILLTKRSLYDAQVEHLQAGKQNPPLSEGAYEVKVAAKLHWNSRDDSPVGHSMTADMSALKDLYISLDEDPDMKKADCVLQTLWRDRSTNLDIVGPYFTSSGKGINV